MMTGKVRRGEGCSCVIVASEGEDRVGTSGVSSLTPLVVWVRLVCLGGWGGSRGGVCLGVGDLNWAGRVVWTEEGAGDRVVRVVRLVQDVAVGFFERAFGAGLSGLARDVGWLLRWF
jgi:hypothetical protein